MLSSQFIAIFKPNQPHNHLYCTNKNHAFMSCNDQTAKALNFACEQEVIGKRMYDLDKNSSSDYLDNNELVLKTGVSKIFSESAIVNGETFTWLFHKYP